jgi:hypothetical protein
MTPQLSRGRAANSLTLTDGAGLDARFNNPSGLATDGTNIYVADAGNSAVRAISIAAAQVSTIAGYGTSANTDGTGTGAQLSDPCGFCIAGSNLYAACFGLPAIMKVTTPGAVVTTLTNPVAGETSPSLYPMFSATDGIRLWVSVPAD